MIIITGIISAIHAYLWNKIFLKKIGNKGLITVVPLIEEISKSLAAVLFSTSLLGTHFIFGIIEGGYDIITSSKKIGKMAALASVISHSIFGLITWQVYFRIGRILPAIIIACLFHSGWNWYITKYL
ncbi:hypothetical protein [Alkaliphilus serpentinus]|uniref:CPBP family intramembrane metalloprotease n=1 Tax=Alkaliphilus serpentinus TaxID=1482731 RepID=A0A833HQN2_9FIRM|nr:hypothetical protein [Alkaliphilus serpentinus]KAB3531847.1 hypothetical protein F8153_03770 [Alkaliphilus serpentinus]